MKRLLFAVLLLTATTMTAQELTTAGGDMASVTNIEGKSLKKKESNKLAKLQMELAALKKENNQLKKELEAREYCKESVHVKLGELDPATVWRQRNKVKRNQNTLPPPL